MTNDVLTDVLAPMMKAAVMPVPERTVCVALEDKLSTVILVFNCTLGRMIAEYEFAPFLNTRSICAQTGVYVDIIAESPLVASMLQPASIPMMVSCWSISVVEKFTLPKMMDCAIGVLDNSFSMLFSVLSSCEMDVLSRRTFT